MYDLTLQTQFMIKLEYLFPENLQNIIKLSILVVKLVKIETCFSYKPSRARLKDGKNRNKNLS